MKYVSIIVDLPVKQVNQTFSYHIPEKLEETIGLGKKVIVPFGPRKIEGYIVEIKKQVEFETKPIIKVASDYSLFDQELLELAEWMANYYQCYLISALKAIIPSGKQRVKTKRVVNLAQSDQETNEIISQLEKRAPKQAAVLFYLVKNPAQQLITTNLAKKVNTSSGTIRRLFKKGLIDYNKEEVKRIPYQDTNFKKTTPLAPTPEQEVALSEIKAAINSQLDTTFLLKGVTGSGKTEVYLQSISEVLSQGQEAIVLIPEIALTPQTIARFKGRFGKQVAVLHSQLSSGERFDEWRRIKEGKAKIAVGARSAIFAPFSNLGLIVIDEEHETTYKQEDHPKYHAREVAVKRAKLNQAVTILGTATPSLESYYRAQKEEYKLLELSKRIEDRPLPKVELVDMRQELEAGNKQMLSRSLEKEIKARLEVDEQVIIFLNRRGFSTFVQCRKCGYVMECDECDVSLTYFSQSQILKCNYCDFTTKIPEECPDCGSSYIKYFGVGTEKVERALQEIFPEANIARMDRDTTTKKGAYQRILSSFSAGEIDILVGTQMIAKGHDYPNVTLVGVITADTALNLPDFRASERTFQLLAQVAGRTGRGAKAGQVIIQSYTPEHYSIQQAKEHDYQSFYEQEIIFREEMEYPPVTHLINIIVSDKSEDKTIKVAQRLGEIINAKLKDTADKQLLGPVQAPLSKIRGEYRWQLLLKGRNLEELRQLNQMSLQELEEVKELKSVKISIDIDPIGVL
ncbi:primosomal protein N'' [Halobacteroides halobius DSM 5150]|uniref:Replication restart protein PriA n=1 Tax=Halobacteroides halobius (strain ATCC 35273 / DSM 5150 / MD-1) TaxID=748449 RepID=L0K773_HALHC|nr:primosomal protein N' [Halobacteroides halobius]AGB40846.1 primosomal protein N'' [Halobacteroides halobius DSM 5150]